MKTIINNLLNGNNDAINQVNTEIGGMGRNAKKAFGEKLTAEEGKLKKLAKAQRAGKLLKMITECNTEFPRSKSRTKGTTRQNNPWLNSRKKTVLQIDKTTGAVIAEHESVQAAHRATKISDSSICYCCNGRYGFKSAGGFKWAYKEGYVPAAEKQEAAATEA